MTTRAINNRRYFNSPDPAGYGSGLVCRKVCAASRGDVGDRTLRKQKIGRGERIRTSDSCVPNAVLYQAELHPDGGEKREGEAFQLAALDS